MRLIVNADDAGIDESRNRGIARCMREGIITSLSVIVCQAGWDDIVQRIGTTGIKGAGLHFNLTAGRPLAGSLKTLVREDGTFFDKFELLKRARQQTLDLEEVEQEFLAQKRAFASLGTPDHFDGHNHIHMLPGIRDVFKRVVPKGSWVRMPRESGRPAVAAESDEPPRLLYNSAERLVSWMNDLSREAVNIWEERYLYADDFGGTILVDNPTPGGYKNEIRRLRGGIAELMCHPGGAPDEKSVRFSRLEQRQRERDILCSPDLRMFLEENNIELVSFSDLV